MLGNIQIKQTTKEVILNMNVQANNSQIVKELQERLPKLKELYKDSKLPIRITGKLFTETERKIIEKIIITELPIKVKFDDTDDLLGLHAIKKTYEIETEISETKYIYNSIRSGNREEYAGSIVICGDVNAGAEIIAGGNITITGTLRGVVHAGANGNTKATISANSIDPTQIRISNLVKEIDEKIEKSPVFVVEVNHIELKN